jgi:hypothetical protein
MVIRLIEQISEHYKANISNRFIRPALLQLPLDKMNWDQIEVLTEKMEQFQYQGFHLDDLYHQIAAAARFVSLARRELVPTLRVRLGSSASGSADRVFREMAVNNFGSNLQLFADMLNELFLKLVEIDKNATKKDRKPLYLQIPELSDIGRQLVGN